MIQTKFMGQMENKKVYTRKISLIFRESEYISCFPKQLLYQESGIMKNVIKEGLSLDDFLSIIWDALYLIYNYDWKPIDLVSFNEAIYIISAYLYET